MRHRCSLRLVVGFVLMALALPSIVFAADASPARKSAGVIKIGSITILTGPTAQIGLETARGAEFMVSYQNKRGGVLGKQLDLVSTDNANNAQLAVQAAANLIQQEHVAVIAGPTDSASGIAIQKLQEDGKVPAVAYQSGAEALTGTGSQWVFRSNPTLSHSFDALVTYLAKVKKHKQFAFIGWNLAAGSSSLAGVQVGIKQNAGTSLAYQTQLPLTTQDFSGAIAQAKAANPDALVIGGPMPFAGVLAKQIRQSGWNVEIGASGDFLTSDFGQFLGSSANGLVMSDTGHWQCSAKRKLGKAFLAAWNKQFGRPPIANELVGADTIAIIVAAIRKAGSTDGQKIADALRRMEYNGLRYAGKWDAKGNLKHTPVPGVVWANDGAQLNLLTCDILPSVRK